MIQKTQDMESIIMEPIEHTIRQFGGIANLSRRLEVPYQTVWKWQRRGNIPPSFQRRILLEASKDGLDITPEDLILGRYLFLSPVIQKLRELKDEDRGVRSHVVKYALTSVNPIKSLFEFTQSGLNSIASKNVLRVYIVDDIFNNNYAQIEEIRKKLKKVIPSSADPKEFLVNLAFKYVAKTTLESLESKIKESRT